ncbi:MAG TPA: hypothetical protein VMW65_16085 [Chloroflexota bacterium]|nr:hypothetical protein [Chloroflexota bacterium]
MKLAERFIGARLAPWRSVPPFNNRDYGVAVGVDWPLADAVGVKVGVSVGVSVGVIVPLVGLVVAAGVVLDVVGVVAPDVVVGVVAPGVMAEGVVAPGVVAAAGVPAAGVPTDGVIPGTWVVATPGVEAVDGAVVGGAVVADEQAARNKVSAKLAARRLNACPRVRHKNDRIDSTPQCFQFSREFPFRGSLGLILIKVVADRALLTGRRYEATSPDLAVRPLGTGTQRGRVQYSLVRYDAVLPEYKSS